MKKKTKKTRTQGTVKFIITLFIACGCLASLMSAPVYGQQFKPHYLYYNFTLGAKAMGMGNAFTAVADDPSAVFWNPAGPAEFLRPQIMVNYRSDKMSYTYDSQESQAGATTQKYGADFTSELKQFDAFAITVPAYFWDLRWNFGLSYYRLIPYAMKGSNTTTHTTYTGLDTNAAVSLIDTTAFSGENGIDVIGFTASYLLSDYFSLGLTVQQFMNSGTTTHHYTPAAGDPYTITYTEKFEGRNLIWGAIFKPMHGMVLGMTYRTKLKNKFSSEYLNQQINSATSDSSKTDAEIPARLSFGAQFILFDWMRLAADYSIIYWGQGKVTNYYGNGTDLEYPVRNDFTFTQKDVVNYRLGVEFKIPLHNLNVFLRSGLFSELPLFVDSNADGIKIKGYSFGIGFQVARSADLNISYMKQTADWVENAYFDTTQTVNTNLSNQIVNISFTVCFGRPPDNVK